ADDRVAALTGVEHEVRLVALLGGHLGDVDLAVDQLLRVGPQQDRRAQAAAVVGARPELPAAVGLAERIGHATGRLAGRGDRQAARRLADRARAAQTVAEAADAVVETPLLRVERPAVELVATDGPESGARADHRHGARVAGLDRSTAGLRAGGLRLGGRSGCGRGGGR